ncbi:e3 ubiquitin-protein ligase march2-like [Stylonychia lemnae]|uniref:E3 ubiquitin-protein ligase march2-like n=1 Tax=Stylonychia lemnae TaxID=5949 RepID=A0A077ZXL3_STYLE|nr:e3 ubiquitin-protein ligase march2-like [Stylonychia lemnae]|eukprot:CDW73967.1 e3 ubiquitin-protein ligase march2-like [Stylonychia lemnae]
MNQEQSQQYYDEYQSSPCGVSEGSENNNNDEQNRSDNNGDQSQPQKDCRICFGSRGPLIEPCDCKGSMAYVHTQCLQKWLQSKNTMQCELCHFQIKSQLTLRSFGKIAFDLWRALKKKFSKDQFFLIKILLYSAYIYISAKKAVSCFRLLAQQLRKRYESLSFNILSIMYLIFVLVQLFMLYTSEISQIYRKLKMKMRLICYEMAFQNK